MTYTELKAKWEARIASYSLTGVSAKNPSGISKEEAKFIALIEEFLADAHDAISHEHEHPQTEPCNCVADGPWHELATWGGEVPAEGAAVTIPEGKTVTITQSPARIGDLVVNGTLIVADVPDIVIVAASVMIHGEVYYNFPGTPRMNEVRTTTDGLTNIPGMGMRPFGVMGGHLEAVGWTPEVVWTRLLMQASEGDTTIYLQEDVSDWPIGSEIVIAPTGKQWDEFEVRTIVGGDGGALFLDQPLQHTHLAETVQCPNAAPNAPQSIPKYAEVGLLNRKIVFASPADAETTGIGSHIMIMGTDSTANVEGIEMRNMGQDGILGRYPIHWHNVNDGGANSRCHRNVVNRSHQRGITIHKTNKLEASENIIFHHKGHGFFWEDSVEVDNYVHHNLVIGTMPGTLDRKIGAQQVTISAAYWISNPNNRVEHNVAAGFAPCCTPFWYDVPETINPASISADPDYRPKLQPMGTFKGNTAHSGINDRGNPDLGGWMLGISFSHQVDGREHLFRDFTCYGGGWVPAIYNTDMVYDVAVLEGFRVESDMPLFKGNMIFKDSLAVAESAASTFSIPYDGVPKAEGSAILGFTQLFGETGNHERSSAAWADTCDMTGTTQTPPLPADVFAFLLPDPTGSFGNGPGAFVASGFSPLTHTHLNVRHSGAGKMFVDGAPVANPREAVDSSAVLSINEHHDVTFDPPGGHVDYITAGEQQGGVYGARIKAPMPAHSVVSIAFQRPAGLVNVGAPAVDTIEDFHAAESTCFHVVGETLYLKISCVDRTVVGFDYGQ